RESRWLALAEISEDHAAAHRDRIGFVLDRTAEILARRFGRLLQALAVHVVEPAVIDAAQPAILDPAVAQIGAAMRTMQVEQADAVFFVFEQHEFLMQRLHFERRVFRDVGEHRDRLPIAAEQLAERRIRSGARHQLVLLFRQHPMPLKALGCQASAYNLARTAKTRELTSISSASARNRPP